MFEGFRIVGLQKQTMGGGTGVSAAGRARRVQDPGETIRRGDREAIYAIELLAEAGKLGYMGANVPAEYGGHKIDGVAYAILIEEVSRVCSTTGVTLAVHNSLGNLPIYLFGTDGQKKQYLPRFFSGEWIGGFMIADVATKVDAARLLTYHAAALEDSGGRFGKAQEASGITRRC